MTNKQTYTEQWFYSKGLYQLNNKLLKYAGEGIGPIPISNFDWEFELPAEELDWKCLASLINEEGAKALFQKYENGEQDVLIWSK